MQIPIPNNMDDNPEPLAEAGLKPEQIKILHEFRGKVQGVLKPHQDDHYLLTWLRVCRFDIPKAEKMLRNNVTWRKDWRADTILDDYEPPEVLAKYWPGSQFGFDKEGHPVIISASGNFDMRGLFNSVKKEDIIKFTIYNLESFRKTGRDNGKKIGKRVEQLTTINDMEGCSWRKLWVPEMVVLMKEVMSMMEANYPENAYHIFTVNAPSIFGILFQVGKAIMSEDSKRAVKVLGGNWKEQLLVYIDADQLPEHWGGTCTDPDGDKQCLSKITIGGDVPKTFYRSELVLFDPEKMKTITVGARSSEQVEVYIDKPGDIMSWIFRTKNHDIKMCMYQKKDVGDDREIITTKLADCHPIPEEGRAVCDEEGTYVLKFDNTYSWIHSKEVTYQIDIHDKESDLPD